MRLHIRWQPHYRDSVHQQLEVRKADLGAHEFSDDRFQSKIGLKSSADGILIIHEDPKATVESEDDKTRSGTAKAML